MAEYINRKEYCEKHCRCSSEYCDKESCPIWKAPVSDVVPVVRYEQCVHSYDDISGRCCIYADGPVKDDFFCGYGERNEVILGGLEAGGG